jgi:ornithine cyclodeaminase/alanine dehydrogenase-like protein (mu-crystallin family)
MPQASGSLLATRYIGPPAPKYIACFGAGTQIKAHLELFCKAYPSIRDVTIVNRTLNDRTRALCGWLTAKFPSVTFQALEFVYDESRSESGANKPDAQIKVAQAEIIICATSSKTALFPSHWVPAGTHIILIGSYTAEMREIDDVLLQRAIPSSTSSDLYGEKHLPGASGACLLVDSRVACMQEFGELVQAGLDPSVMLEIGEVTAARRSQQSAMPKVIERRQDDVHGPVTIFKSVGVGLQDTAIASSVLDKALAMRRDDTNNPVGTLINNYDVT